MGIKETRADELRGKRIRVTSDGIYPYQATFTRLDTNEVIQNIRSARLEWDASHILCITLWLVYMDPTDKRVKQEAVLLDTPELDVEALVYREDAVQEQVCQEITILSSYVHDLIHENEQLQTELASIRSSMNMSSTIRKDE